MGRTEGCEMTEESIHSNVHIRHNEQVSPSLLVTLKFFKVLFFSGDNAASYFLNGSDLVT